MNTRKHTGPPYSKRHLRRLRKRNRSLLFEKVSTRFRQYVNSSTESFVTNIAKDEDNINTTSKINADLINKTSLNSIKNSHYLSKICNEQCNQSSIKDTSTLQILQYRDCDFSTEEVQLFEETKNETKTDENQGENKFTGSLDDYINFLKEDLEDFNDNSDSTESESDCENENEQSNLLETCKKDEQFVNEIRQWSKDYIHTIPHSAINDLLSILRCNTNTPFPKDARILMKTPRSTHIIKMDSGYYWHCGLKNAVIKFISSIVQKNINVDQIDLLINIDGAPLAKSSEKGLWIISCSETVLKEVELVGLYYGEDKPSDSNELIKLFVNELKDLCQSGMEYGGKKFKIKLTCLVCDTPAKAYILKVKYHTGYWSCTKCNKRGTWDGKLCFPGEIGILRTDEGFKEYLYVDDGLNDGYQQNKTILCDIPDFGLVTNVILDYMHLICLGVMLKLIELWISGPTNFKLSDQQRQSISERLLNLKNYMPSDFSRKPRQFKNVARLWKAHELRQFLLYSGPVVLFGILRDQIYHNFLQFHVAISILVNPILCRNLEYLIIASDLLKHFVKDYEIIYTAKNVTFNTHNLLHIVDDVRNFGSLDVYSAFRFENYIRKIKQLVRKGDKPLQQIARRISELNDSKSRDKQSAKDSRENIIALQKSHNDGPIISFHLGMCQFRILRTNNMYLNCLDDKNNCVLLNVGIYIRCINFVKHADNTAYVIGKAYNIIKSYYCEPVDSQKLNVVLVESSENLKMYPCNNIFTKICKMPFKNYFVLFPMMHTKSVDMP